MRKGSKHTPETIEKIRIANTGKVLTPEQRAAISVNVKAHMSDPVIRARAIENMRRACVGRPQSAEHIAKRSAAMTGKTQTPEHKAAIQASKAANKLARQLLSMTEAGVPSGLSATSE